ncbi:MAG: DUF882 domain-containing protein [Candidatus Omnitrophica bacterium]|nr:DUF882 domain-containing protein [Candidatus Omnitrophota bacterium]
MNPEFMEKLVDLREALNSPMRINSAYRTPEHNSRVSSSGLNGPHTTGKAIDIGIAGEPAYHMVLLAMSMGFTGIGVRQSGDWNGRFIHLDCLENEETRPRPALWSYP